MSSLIELLKVRRSFKVQKRALPSGHKILWLAYHRDHNSIVRGDGPTPYEAISDALIKSGHEGSTWVSISAEKVASRDEKRPKFNRVWEIWGIIPRIETGYDPDSGCWAQIEGTTRRYFSSTKKLAIEKLQREDEQWVEAIKKIS